ncbi:MAG: hypothetical protein ACOC7U_09180, partial [Spirochaetota bacterium]
MTVIIRKLQNTEKGYFAYAKSLCGKATYLVYFEDSVWGAVTLYSFVEMLRTYFQQNTVNVKISNQDILIKNEM